MLQNSSEFNSVGPGLGGFGGGFGGIAPFGLFGLLGLGNRGGLFGGEDGHRGGGGDSCAREAALLAAIGNAKDVSVAESRALGAAICDAEKTNLQQFYAGAIQAANNTNQLQNQAQAIAALTDSKLDAISVKTDMQSCEILRAINADGDATRALINANTIAALRDEIECGRRRLDARDLEINITNTNTNIQAQLQAQAQIQTQRDFDHQRRFDALFSQVAKSSQDIINVGGILAGVSQAANPTNVNSKS